MQSNISLDKICVIINYQTHAVSTKEAMTKGIHRLNSFFALTVVLCLTALFSVFSLSKAVSAAPQSAEAELQRFGIQGTVTASTYGNNPNGFMARVNDKNYIVDLANNRIASIENHDYFFNELLLKRTKKDGLAIVQFLIHNDGYGKDFKCGEWRGSHHLFPMYILFEYDANGNAVPEGRIFSGEGAAPGHYHSTVYEQKNIDLAKLFLSQAFLFAENAGFSAAAVGKWPGNYPGVITGNDVNIRTGPGQSYKSLGVFFYGDNVTLLNKITAADGDTWYEVKYYNKDYGWIQGWVYGKFIEERNNK